MLAVTKNVILRTLKNPKYLIFNAVLPIILILLIGSLIGNAGLNGPDNINKTVYYTTSNNNAEVNESFNILKDGFTKGDIIFNFIKVNDKSEALNKVKKDGDIYLNIENNKASIYTTANDTTSYTVLSSALQGINKGIYVVKEVYKNDYLNSKSVMDAKATVPVTLKSKDSAPSGYNYYGIVEIPMICLFIMLFPLSGYKEDKIKKIKERIVLSGISNKKYILGNTLGYFLLSFLITGPGFLITKFFLNVNWGTNPILYYVAIQTLAFLSISIGTFLINAIGDLDKVITLIQAAILPILSFLGGAYVSIPYSGNMGIFGYVTDISPLRWINKGLFLSIYNGQNSLLIYTMIIFVIIGIILTGITLIVDRKGEVRI
ncbi:MAG: ABC transporter permease [Clostridium sp.]